MELPAPIAVRWGLVLNLLPDVRETVARMALMSLLKAIFRAWYDSR
jgi:hypothetical protein